MPAIDHPIRKAGLFELPGALPKPKCRVRAAAEGDMAAVTAIYREFVENSTATFELVAPDQAEMLRRRRGAPSAGRAAICRE